MSDKVRVKTASLFDAVAFVRPFIGGQTAEQPSYTKLIWFEKTVLGQDGVVGAAAATPAAAPGAFAMDGGRLHDILSNLTREDEIDLRFTEQNLVITGKNSKALVRITPADHVNFSRPQWPTKAQLKEVSPEFARALNFAKFCIDTSARGEIGPTGSLCLTPDGTAWATDGSRAINIPYVSDLGLRDQCLLPFKSLQFVGENDPPERAGLAGTLFWFSWNNRRTWTRTTTPPFPNLERVFVEARKLAKACPVIKIDTAEMGGAVSMAESADGYGMEVQLDGNLLKLKCRGEFAEIELKQEILKSRIAGSVTFVAEAKKLKDAFSRFSQLAVCGQGVLYFFDYLPPIGDGPKTSVEHVVMELVSQTPEAMAQTTATPDQAES